MNTKRTRRRPRHTIEPLESRLALDSTVVFSELMYNPLGDEQLEWIELYNEMSVDMDLSHWSLDGVDYRFPMGTVLPAGELLIVAKSPDLFFAASGMAGALGPYQGRLDNGGETLGLINNNGRVMDQLRYDDGGPWPVGPDGSGATLAKIRLDGGTQHADNWTTSDRIGGTPGAINFRHGVRLGETRELISLDQNWRYTDRALALTDDWVNVDYNPDDPNGDGRSDDRWKSGVAPLSSSEANLAFPISTILDSVPTTVYFRTEFTFGREVDSTSIQMSSIVDDGAIVYLNGQEVARLNMPAGPVSFDTPAKTFVEQPAAHDKIQIPSHALRRGRNVLAIEVHQANQRDPMGGPILPARIMRSNAQEGFSLVWDGTDGKHFDSDSPPQGAQAPRNRALATEGAQAFSSSDLGPEVGTPYHVKENLNDGYYGNSNSWIGGDSNPFAQPFAGIAFPEPILVERIAWGRDNGNDTSDACGGQCTDRTRGTYALQFTTAANPGANTENTGNAATGWQSIGFVTYRGDQDDRPSGGFTSYLRHEYLVRRLGRPVEATAIRILVPASGSERGTAIDEIEVYAAEATTGADVTWAATLTASEILSASNGVAFSEVAAATDPQFFVELVNGGDEPLDLAGMTITGSNDDEFAYQFGATSLAAGEHLTLSRFDLSSSERNSLIDTGERLFLLSADQTIVVDAVRLDDHPQAIHNERPGRWMYPSELTPGRSNQFAIETDVVVNEIMYHAPALTGDATEHGDLPFTQDEVYRPSDEEWIELYNRSASRTIDISGWTLRNAVNYQFPNGTRITPGAYLLVARNLRALTNKYPDRSSSILGQYEGVLSNRGERIELADALGNVVDEVVYHDSGRWHGGADGGGSSLELRDPQADNNLPEAWAASNESHRSDWHTIRYRGVVQPDGFRNTVTDRYHELILGLLDAGEVLVDDVSVVESPEAAAIERIQNGSFQSDPLNTAPAKWRIGGNHHGVVVQDPTNSNNRVLRLTASGAAEDRLNHAETTFVDNADISVGTTYEISYRAKWISGSNLLNSHLYFDRLPRTVRLPRGQLAGTPGGSNSQRIDNLGPTHTDLNHTPTIPRPNQAVHVSVSVDDPDGVTSARLWWSVDSGPFESTLMSRSGDTYSSSIPGQAAGQVVQFFVASIDQRDERSYFPARGRDSRALFVVDDGQGRDGIHNLRIIMTPDDRDRLHERTNVTSNHRLGATVISNQQDIFYDAGVRLKGSNAGRSNDAFLGFNVAFDPMKRFRGVHETVSIDRSGRSAATPRTQDEILIKHIGNRAGDIPYMYDDLVHVIAPQPRHTRTALLMMAKYGDEFLDTQFDDGSDGTVFKLDIAYVPNTTVDRRDPESAKIPFPYSHPQPTRDLEDLGDDKERYRSHLLIRNHRDRDDYSRIIQAAKILDQRGPQWVEEAREIVDLDQWSRVFALQSLTGAADVYTRGGLHHNISFYVRPSDDRILALPWDWDFAFTASTSQPLIGSSGNGGRLMSQPTVRRLYHGHLLDIINTTFHNDYLDPWIDHYGEVAEQNLAPIKNYVRQRRSFVLRRLPDAIPFQITMGDGQAVTTDQSSITLRGRGWIDVRHIRHDATGQQLDVSWLDDETWETTVALKAGENRVALTALDHQRNEVGRSVMDITSTSESSVATSLRISEVHYHPAAPTAAELTELPFLDKNDFEFVELTNVGSTAVNLANLRFRDGIDFVFPAMDLHPGQATVVVQDAAAFALRYGQVASVAGEFASGRLSNGGERIELVDAFDQTILELTYDDRVPWPTAADGHGASLELIMPNETSADQLGDWYRWRASVVAGGTPGHVSQPPVSIPGDLNRDGMLDHLDIQRSALLHVRHSVGADLNGDGQSSEADYRFLIQTLVGVPLGDSNLDGRFDSRDLVMIFQAGEFEDPFVGNSTWVEGDWDGDGDFTTQDFVAAFTEGSYLADAKRSG